VLERAQLVVRFLLTGKKLLDNRLTSARVELGDLRTVFLEPVIFAFFERRNGSRGAEYFGSPLDQLGEGAPRSRGVAGRAP
jgi:hypothetical protein